MVSYCGKPGSYYYTDTYIDLVVYSVIRSTAFS